MSTVFHRLKLGFRKKKQEDDDPWAKKPSERELAEKRLAAKKNAADKAAQASEQEQVVHYAGFWIRVGAAIVDMILYAPFYALCLYLIPGQFAGDAVFMVFALVTYTWWFASKWKGTPGMRIMKFHICDTHFQPITHLRSFMWGITGLVGWLFAGAGLFYLMAKYDLIAINAYMTSDEVKQSGMDPVHLEALFGTSVQEYLFYAAWSVGMFFLLSFIWALSIGMSKQKAGFHNILCRTRFVMDAKKN